MRSVKTAAFVLPVALLGVVGWPAYRAGWLERFARTPACAEASEAFFKDSIIEYGHSSSGVVGTYISVLSIDKSGHAMLGYGLGVPFPGAGETQLTSEELANLLHTGKVAGFAAFRNCYGRRAEVNPQNTWMVYRWDGKEKGVMWMSDPADPKPPQGWFRIAELLEQIEVRARKHAPSPHP